MKKFTNTWTIAAQTWKENGGESELESLTEDNLKDTLKKWRDDYELQQKAESIVSKYCRKTGYTKDSLDPIKLVLYILKKGEL